jgi:hypothetical protein
MSSLPDSATKSYCILLGYTIDLRIPTLLASYYSSYFGTSALEVIY